MRSEKEAASSQQPAASTCSDLISRQAAIDYFVTNIVVVDEDGFPVDDYDERMKVWTERFSGIPSVEPKRKKGEWVKEDLSGYLTPGGNSIYHCSECGHTEGPWPHPRLTNFCPNCGADMRGEDEDA